MITNRPLRFWKEYIKVNEIEQRKLLLSLTGICECNVTLFKSYIDDIFENIDKITYNENWAKSK